MKISRTMRRANPRRLRYGVIFPGTRNCMAGMLLLDKGPTNRNVVDQLHSLPQGRGCALRGIVSVEHRVDRMLILRQYNFYAHIGDFAVDSQTHDTIRIPGRKLLGETV